MQRTINHGRHRSTDRPRPRYSAAEMAQARRPTRFRPRERILYRAQSRRSKGFRPRVDPPPEIIGAFSSMYNDSVNAQFRTRVLNQQSFDLLADLTTYYVQLANITSNVWRQGQINAGNTGRFTTEVLDSIYFEARKYIYMLRYYMNLADPHLTAAQWDTYFNNLIARPYTAIEATVRSEDHTKMQKFLDTKWQQLGLDPGLAVLGGTHVPTDASFTWGQVYQDLYTVPHDQPHGHQTLGPNVYGWH